MQSIPAQSPTPPTATVAPARTAARSSWARLIARISEAFPLLCPDCGAEMRIIAFLTDPEPVDAILRHLSLPATAPPLSPARGPPQRDLELHFDGEHLLDMEQTSAFDPTEPEPVTPLYPIVQHHLETFPADAAAADPMGDGVPCWVEADFRAYLRCGILAHGFARIRCDACAAERIVAFLVQGPRSMPLV